MHVDVKKIGRIPDGGGWRAHGRGTDGHRASKRGQRPGYVYLHTAIDDRSRLAYTEELADEKSVTAAGFWARAVEFFAAHGIEQDPPGADRQRLLLPRESFQRRSRRHGPQAHPPLPAANQREGREVPPDPGPGVGLPPGLVLQRGTSRRTTGFLHRYNYHRPHTALKRPTTDLPHPGRYQPLWVQQLAQARYRSPATLSTVPPPAAPNNGTVARFRPTRCGVMNLWDYRDEEFVFADGRLVLRGPNGSGKTKALEVLFPFLFDGRIEPRRLNPFAGEERTMRSNLLYRGQESAYAYVWMEFRRDSDRAGRRSGGRHGGRRAACAAADRPGDPVVFRHRRSGRTRISRCWVRTIGR